MAKVQELDQKRIVGVVFKALLIDLFSFTIILPLFPRLLNYYQSEEIGHQVSFQKKKKKNQFMNMLYLRYICI